MLQTRAGSGRSSVVVGGCGGRRLGDACRFEQTRKVGVADRRIVGGCVLGGECFGGESLQVAAGAKIFFVEAASSYLD